MRQNRYFYNNAGKRVAGMREVTLPVVGRVSINDAYCYLVMKYVDTHSPDISSEVPDHIIADAHESAYNEIEYLVSAGGGGVPIWDEVNPELNHHEADYTYKHEMNAGGGHWFTTGTMSDFPSSY
ncbi:hypothetical protein [Vibrio alginolyticus]|uniref:hypothetical protein n=1 Tax=Vibrio alginolyticus TaxID=663 RepID=UPI001BD6B1D6|nr:hypothetical protein [Vibrio alginolyticus]ELB2885418.1 hypothetical protein [Vibrio alginolyticus]MBS9861425.1 hypothetical protein [Vibrio alginolyticus]